MKLRITALDDDGAGWGEDKGERVRVAGAFPGDVVEAAPFHYAKQRRFHDARLVQLVTASSDRAALPCPIWRSDCACPIMPLTASAQATFKHALVQAAFPGVSVAPMRKAALREHYRSKVTLVWDGKRFGGYARGTHEVLDLHGCVIEAPLLARVADWLRRESKTQRMTELRYVAMRANASAALVTLIGRGHAPSWARQVGECLQRDVPNVRGVSWSTNDSQGNAIWVAPAATLVGADTIEEVVGDLRVQLSPSSFFQVHRAQAAALREALVEALAGSASVWDLFCGIGVNAIALAARGANVVGIESHEGAVQDATANATRLRLPARFITSSLEEPDPQIFAALPKPLRRRAARHHHRSGRCAACLAVVVFFTFCRSW